MIDFVKGQIAYKERDSLVVDVGGIGYRVYVPHVQNWSEGQEALIFTHLIIREESWQLYGFVSKEERDLFRMLLDVSGIGPKAGLSILTYRSPGQIATAIQMEDLSMLIKIPGIGKKTAQRMIFDLKDKLKEHAFMPTPVNREIEHVIAALVSLGYNEEEARQAAQSVSESSLNLEEWIRRALKLLAKS